MASRNRRTTAPEAVVEPTETMTNSYTAEQGGNVITAAWRGLYWLFGARASGFEAIDNGITVHGLTFGEGFDADTIINDIFRRGDKTVQPRLNFFETMPTVLGEIPAQFTNADQLTAWMVRYMKGGSRSPKYVKDAIQAYKEAHGIAVHRGRPKKIVRITEIGQLDTNALREVPKEEREALMATLSEIEASAK